MSREEIETRVLASLEELRPYLVVDGGDISLVEITEDFTARVQLHGACVNCNMSAMTMRAGVEEAIKNAAPMIRKVEEVRN